MVKKKTCVFISGQGSNLKNLISRSRDNSFPIKISLVISNNRKAKGISYAKKYKIPFMLINTKIRNYEFKVLKKLERFQIEFICLAGYMKIVPDKIINKFEKKIINIHPSLLPKFKGLNTFQRALKSKEKKSGCTVHYVNNKLDDGLIIIKKVFFLKSKDNETSLKQKTHKLEHKAYPEAIIKIFRYR